MSVGFSHVSQKQMQSYLLVSTYGIRLQLNLSNEINLTAYIKCNWIILLRVFNFFILEHYPGLIPSLIRLWV